MMSARWIFLSPSPPPVNVTLIFVQKLLFHPVARSTSLRKLKIMVAAKSPACAVRTARANRAARRAFTKHLFSKQRQMDLMQMRGRDTPGLYECKKCGARRTVTGYGRSVRCIGPMGCGKQHRYWTSVAAASPCPSPPADSCLLFLDGRLPVDSTTTEVPVDQPTDSAAKPDNQGLCLLFSDGCLSVGSIPHDTTPCLLFSDGRLPSDAGPVPIVYTRHNRVVARHALYTVLAGRLETGQWIDESVTADTVVEWVRAQYPTWPKMGPNPSQVFRPALCRAARNQLVALVQKNLMTMTKPARSRWIVFTPLPVLRARLQGLMQPWAL